MSSEQPNDTMRQFMSGNAPLIILAVLVFLSVLAICTLGYTLVRSFVIGGSEEAPTPFPEAMGTPVDEDPLVIGISDTTVVTVTVNPPVTLSLAGRDFAVQAQTVSPDGVWSPGLDDENVAGWVDGTIVNYIFGFEGSDLNRESLESLAPGDRIIMTVEGGDSYEFAFEERGFVPVDDQAVFAQKSPGMTLLLLETGGDERLVAYARRADSGRADAGGGVVGVGEVAQLVDLQITVTGVTYVPDRPEAPPGFAFFIVDFQVQNVGSTAVDVSNLQLTLVDEFGNQYALNPVATRLGNNPTLGGLLNAGEGVSATVGYQIPKGLASGSLQWFAVDPATGAQVQVTVPFSGGNAAQNAVITLQSVTVSTDLTSLVLTGTINNTGDQPVVVVEENISLMTNDGASYLLLATNPAFPWGVPPGQTLQYTVTFQRPLAADSAVFTILHQPFELTNLR